MNHVRNYTKIQYEELRQHIDPSITKLHDELEDAYYLNWKIGKEYNFYGYNVKNTIEESKAQFDNLHALLFCLHEELLRELNASLDKDKQHEKLKYEHTVDMLGVKLFRKETNELKKLKLNKEASITLKSALLNKMSDDNIKKVVDIVAV